MLVEITNRYFKTASNHMIVKVTKFFYSVPYVLAPPSLSYADLFLLTFKRLAFHIFNNKIWYLEIWLYQMLLIVVNTAL